MIPSDAAHLDLRALQLDRRCCGAAGRRLLAARHNLGQRRGERLRLERRAHGGWCGRVEGGDDGLCAGKRRSSCCKRDALVRRRLRVRRARRPRRRLAKRVGQALTHAAMPQPRRVRGFGASLALLERQRRGRLVAGELEWLNIGPQSRLHLQASRRGAPRVQAHCGDRLFGWRRRGSVLHWRRRGGRLGCGDCGRRRLDARLVRQAGGGHVLRLRRRCLGQRSGVVRRVQRVARHAARHARAAADGAAEEVAHAPALRRRRGRRRGCLIARRVRAGTHGGSGRSRRRRRHGGSRSADCLDGHGRRADEARRCGGKSGARGASCPAARGGRRLGGASTGVQEQDRWTRGEDDSRAAWMRMEFGRARGVERRCACGLGAGGVGGAARGAVPGARDKHHAA
ncbi:hypothetical protein FA09DRAFT_41640 [Tilletiopsis washingtonensis]|uniref:Uncharacterized protein n=1 Tax=Tilletiopsis washingtonensis TaxID=58919 RepID=A0A316Z8Q6_9BASI|nr:hypothetical protein FA09DRAFT_41640 [Tilletiopsis washingtonensis]PWN97636.1 hypothetical protein FA09DRAFT_41640 [Tilletiopsis washingtonensis]